MRPFFLSLAMALAAAAMEPAFAQAKSGLRIISPGFTLNAGVVDLAKGYEKQTGIRVIVQGAGMSRILDMIKTGNPPADIVFLPKNLMDRLQAEKGIVPSTRTLIGRVHVGLAVRKGLPVPDISSVAKLAKVLKSADYVMYSNPASGSMEARIIDNMLKRRREFAGVKTEVSIKGEGGEAVARGEGPIALQLECEILNHPDMLVDAGPLPEELGAYMDGYAAVSARSTHQKQAEDWLKYATQPGTYSLWLAKGLNRPAVRWMPDDKQEADVTHVRLKKR